MKQILDSAQYVFTPGAANAGTIQFRPDLVTGNTVTLDQIQLITNVTRNTVIYDFGDTTLGEYAFSNATSTLTLVASTTGQSATDTLQIIVDVPVDPYAANPMWGRDPSGNPTTLSLTETGQMLPADGRTLVGSAAGTAVGTILSLDTTGFGAVSVQLQGTFTGTITFQSSNDLTAWSSTAGWSIAGGATPITTATAVGQWIFPCVGKFFRVRVTTAGTGNPVAIATLKNASAWFPASTLSTNTSQIGGTAVVTGGVAGILAIGGNIAVGSAPTANPIPLAWDGTNTRRILTDASNGGVVLGSNALTNGQTLARFSQTVTTPAATQIKASAGRLTMLTVANGAAVAGYIHLYNASSVTLGTTSDVHVYAIPGAVANYTITLPDGGLFFSAGIGAAFTNGTTATDNTVFGTAPTLIANYAFI
jgi:hypothetical protein